MDIYIQPWVTIVFRGPYDKVGLLDKNGDIVEKSLIDIGLSEKAKKTHWKSLQIKGFSKGRI
jgi:hypothetical protein